jgi:hypothetical protein
VNYTRRCQHERARLGPVVLQCNRVTTRGRKLCDKHTRKEAIKPEILHDPAGEIELREEGGEQKP